jgi:hypothetical protein
MGKTSRIAYTNIAQSFVIVESSKFLKIPIDSASDKKYHKTSKQNYFFLDP